MKTISRILFILGVIIFIASCSEDIYLHDGKDGAEGQKGDKGDRGYSVVTKVDTVYNVTKDTAIGQFTGNYTDIDINGIYSVGDVWQGTGIFTPFIRNGKNGINGSSGSNGSDGISSTISMYKLPPSPECLNGTVVYKTYKNNVATNDSLYFCIPEDGLNGDTYIPTFMTNTIHLDEFCTVNQIFVDGNLILSDTSCDGQNGTNGHNGKTIVEYLPFIDDCNIGDSYEAKEEGYLLEGTTLSRNHYFANFQSSPNKNGRLVKWEYDTPQANIAWSPKFSEPTAVDSISFDIGSKKEWRIDLFFMHMDGSVTFMKSEITTPDNSFIWYLNYHQRFVYQVGMNNIPFQDVIRYGLLVTKIGNFPIANSDWENETCNMDNFYVHRVRLSII